MKVKQTANMLEVQEDLLKEFKTKDTFNNNTINGVLCRQSGKLYGTMVIFEVNDEEVVPQIIYGTPKLRYPFNREGKFHKLSVDRIIAYEKMDGTNVLKYSYRSPYKDFVSFKTRLGPVISDSGYDVFYSMWKEIMETNTWIKDVIEANPLHNLSFELYGSRNSILIEYDTTLDTMLLFGVRESDGGIVPPMELTTDARTKVPAAHYVDYHKDIIDEYNYLRAHFLGINRGKGKLVVEGAVWYIQHNSVWTMYKLKPEDIENIHWAANGKIPRRSLITTAFNLCESDEPTIGNFIALLKEEYTHQMMHSSMPSIRKIYKEVTKKVKTRNKINKIWLLARKEGLDITEDKTATLRFIGKHFSKREMKVVGSVILQQAGLLKKETDSGLTV